MDETFEVSGVRFGLRDGERWTRELEGKQRQYTQQRQAIQDRRFISDEEKAELLKEHDSRFESVFANDRDTLISAFDDVDRQLNDREAVIRRDAEVKPRSDEDFKRYNERDGFTHDELAKIAAMSPRGVMGEYLAAVRDRDEVRAALIAKHANAVLSNPEDRKEFAGVVRDVQDSRVDRAAIDRVNRLRGSFAKLRDRARIKTREDWRQFGDRFPSLKNGIVEHLG